MSSELPPSVSRRLDDRSHELQELVRICFFHPDWTAENVAYLLTSNGITVSATTVRTYRRLKALRDREGVLEMLKKESGL